jgi:hypothetical protein
MRRSGGRVAVGPQDEVASRWHHDTGREGRFSGSGKIVGDAVTREGDVLPGRVVELDPRGGSAAVVSDREGVCGHQLVDRQLPVDGRIDGGAGVGRAGIEAARRDRSGRRRTAITATDRAEHGGQPSHCCQWAALRETHAFHP